MFKSILVPIDGSEPSEKALMFALGLASSLRANIRFCHVPVRSKFNELGAQIPLSRGVVESQWEDAQRKAQAILDAARYRAEEYGIRAETALRSGTPADAIVRLAEQDGVDLIVMGSHGHEGPIRALVSSTAETVLRAAPVPVLIVGAKAVWDADVSQTPAYS